VDPLPASGSLRFADAALDVATGELRQGERVTLLGALPARLLAVLAWRRGALVTRGEIQRELWPDGTTVEFDQSINQHVRHLRQVLGDDAASPTFIQTLPARGYRFLPPVSYGDPAPAAAPSPSPLPPASPDPDPDPDPDPVASRAPRHARAALAIGAIAGVIAVVALAAAGPTARSLRAQPDAGAVRIAVLPFAADDPAAEARALGLTADVITAVGEGYAPRLEAIALRTVLRYRDRTASSGSIADALGVAYLVEGRVRAVGTRLRVDVQLIRAGDGGQVWARSFEPGGTAGWAADTAIAGDVATTVARMLAPRQVDAEPRLDPETTDALDRGRYLLARGRPRLAVAELERATARSPRSARAWGARAVAEIQAGDAGWAVARSSAAAALALDPEQPEAHLVQATIAFYRDWDVAAAADHYTRAIRANPAYAEAHHHLAAVYSVTGRHDDAIATMRRARELDPLAPEVVSDVGWYYYFARRYAEAADWCRRTLALEPAFYWAHRCIALASIRAGDDAGAVAAVVADLRARGAPPSILAEVTGAAEPRAALRAYWAWDVARTTTPGAPITGDPDAAVSRLELGDREGALAALEAAVAARRGWLVPFLGVDPTFDSLRDDPRFAAVRAATVPATAPSP
jgi:TolB-like protein/DNA-binding winged helix-turn-helix (wHTH) protein/tetratricopeptide (TPR) repeat protein